MRAWLQLVRLPAVFTALADIFLGFLLTHRSFADDPVRFALLLVASVCLYMSGMVLNDVFDREIDARERPSRPIPSGRIPVRSAATAGAVMMTLGVIAAGACGVRSLLTAVVLAGAILAYDGFLKKTPLGPLGMGLCRFLNVMLGASAIPPTELSLAEWPREHWMPAAAVGLYIVGVTLFAKNEAERSNRFALAGATVVVAAGLAAVGYVATQVMKPSNLDGVLIVIALMATIILRRLTTAVFAPAPERVQAAVKLMLMSYVMLDATLVLARTGDVPAALATAALLIPAMLAGRWLYVT